SRAISSIVHLPESEGPRPPTTTDEGWASRPPAGPVVARSELLGQAPTDGAGGRALALGVSPAPISVHAPLFDPDGPLRGLPAPRGLRTLVRTPRAGRLFARERLPSHARRRPQLRGDVPAGHSAGVRDARCDG